LQPFAANVVVAILVKNPRFGRKTVNKQSFIQFYRSDGSVGYVEVNVQVSRHSLKVMSLAPKVPRVITFQEWRDTSTLTYLKSTFTRGLVKYLLDSGHMILMINMFLPFYICIYLKTSDHTKILIQIFKGIDNFPSSLVSRAQVSLPLVVLKVGVRIPASMIIFLYQTLQ
jgi:hypothetical protein